VDYHFLIALRSNGERGRRFLEWSTTWKQLRDLNSEIERLPGCKAPLLGSRPTGPCASSAGPKAVTIFVTAPSRLERRLRAGRPRAGVIDERIETARKQLALRDQFDHRRNDDRDRAADDLQRLSPGSSTGPLPARQ
jgi:hypothetical protein